MEKDKIKLLVVDDEADICEILQFNLENEGFEVDVADSAEKALEIISDEHRLILLDVMMGGISGFRMAEKLRKRDNIVPIIFLTAKDTENDMLTGFSLGGDDYISKPFSIKEVIARVKAVLKRNAIKNSGTKVEDIPGSIDVGNLHINLQTKQLYVDQNAVPLTKKEFEILCLLIKNPSRVFTREEILDKVWKDDAFVLERTVDVHITRLRKKMGEYAYYIANRSGFGYCFDHIN